jgi:hypothetical protein
VAGKIKQSPADLQEAAAEIKPGTAGLQSLIPDLGNRYSIIRNCSLVILFHPKVFLRSQGYKKTGMNCFMPVFYTTYLLLSSDLYFLYLLILQELF